MKRRIIFNFLAGASALLLAVVVALWVRSYRITEGLVQQRCFKSNLPVDEDHPPSELFAWAVTFCSHRGALAIKTICDGDAGPNHPYDRKFWRLVPARPAVDYDDQYCADCVRYLASDIDSTKHFLAATTARPDSDLVRQQWAAGTFALVIEYRLLAALFAVVPGVWLLSYRSRHNKRSRGYCSCGYNLTGNVSGTCPECGNTIIENKRGR
jgi:hypothetical protein